jgi:putative transposase
MKRNRKPNRLGNYNYASDNLYFVTSCVQNRICCFGEIVRTGCDGVGTGRDLSLPKMVLNEFGKIAEKQWYWLAEQYPYITSHAFVVMPNHIHGIVEIDRYRNIEDVYGTGRNNVGTGRNNVGTGRDLSLRMKIKSLSELMGAYKTSVSKQIHLLGLLNFAWQRSFYDHIIRNGCSFNLICDYIRNNPAKWEQDSFFIG